MQRAAAAGFEALVFTTDANVFGSREWDQRNFAAPGRPTVRAALDALRHPRWLYEVLVRHGIPRFRNVESFLPPGKASALGGSTVLPGLFEATITWDDIAWIRQFWRGKLLIKGVLTAGDAERAIALGCDGIVLSNHGGRQLDYCVAAIDMLPEVAAAVGGRMPIIIDGGVRRGTDIVKALALGAQAVMLGRAPLYGLGAGGAAGVARALDMLFTETDRVLGMLGCNSVSELNPQHVRRV
jgi:(S)-mandelate dehydrogenase